MTLTDRDWIQIQDRIRALVAQKGESFAHGVVLKRDVKKRLVWVTGFGQEPIPMYQFNGDIFVYDEWREPDFNIYRFTANTTYHPKVFTKYFEVECLGGGGGGGSTQGSPLHGGGGGSAGGYGFKLVKFATEADIPEAGYAVTIGAKGLGGATGGNAGTDGTATTFIGDGVNISAPGGVGASLAGGGGDATVGTGGDLNLAGQDGHPGQYVFDTAATQLGGAGGNGGSSRYGAGGRGGRQGDGDAATGYGAGGGGGGRGSGANHAGADGSPGIVVVREMRSIKTVKKKLITATPRVPEIGDLVLIAQHVGSRELPKCVGVLQSEGFENYDAGLE